MIYDHAKRRAEVLKRLDNGILILFAAPIAYRNNDVTHEYRQDSDFYYLTGFDEPQSALVLVAGSEKPFQLFVLPKDPERETWDGERVGIEGAVERFGADAAFPISELPTQLAELLKGRKKLFYGLGRDRCTDDTVLGALGKLRERVRRGETCPTEIVEPSVILHEMRSIKCAEEIMSVRQAMEITKAGHHALLTAVHPGMAEYELEAILRQWFRHLGSERCAYPPIVASGRNARILHHRRNDRVIQENELVLVDAAAEFGYMATDVTRTFPSSGKFLPLQRHAYEIVLRAEMRAISTVMPGATLEDVHQAAVEELCIGLIELGILVGTPQELIAAKAYQKYYMHRTSHWMGMDVHDVGNYFLDGQPRSLTPGMMLTVEPGLYFAAEDPAVPEGLKDVGIRIEDDVVVTDSGVENLSQSIVKTVEDIERIMAARPPWSQEIGG